MYYDNDMLLQKDENPIMLWLHLYNSTQVMIWLNHSMAYNVHDYFVFGWQSLFFWHKKYLLL